MINKKRETWYVWALFLSSSTEKQMQDSFRLFRVETMGVKFSKTCNGFYLSLRNFLKNEPMNVY